MEIADCYRVLGLRSGASFAQIKASYRKLARQYHPDINPNDQTAQEKFIALTEAYKRLSSVVPQDEVSSSPPTATKSASYQRSEQRYETVTVPQSAKVRITRKEKPQPAPSPVLSEVDQQLKWNSYRELQHFLKYKRFPQAIALVEGLSQRLPTDPEVRQWQAIVYQRWGRQLIAERELDKARNYLKKALKTDPHNKSLWSEVERDFRLIEKMF